MYKIKPRRVDRLGKDRAKEVSESRKWISWEDFDGFSDNSSFFVYRFADGFIAGR